jgi:hypothetical protein
MGLPQDFCEFALRRCHYNVEMVINMCLENNDDQAGGAALGRSSRQRSNRSYQRCRRHSGLKKPVSACTGLSETTAENATSAAVVDAHIQRLKQRIAAATALSGLGGLSGLDVLSSSMKRSPGTLSETSHHHNHHNHHEHRK